MYKSKYAVFCKKYFLKITQNPVFIRVYRSWCYYTSFIHSSDNASCFHISFSFSAAHKAPLCKGGWQKSLISDWGIVLCRYLTIPPSRLRRATSLYTREALVPTIILQITLLVSVKGRRLYRKKRKTNLPLHLRKGRFIFFEILRL